MTSEHPSIPNIEAARLYLKYMSHTYTVDDAMIQMVLRALAETVGTQKKAAKMFGVSATYYNTVVTGRVPVGERIREALGLTQVTTYEVE